MQPLFIVDGTKVGLHQTGEHLRLRPLPRLSGLWIGNIRKTVSRRVAMLGLIGLDKVVSPVPLVRVQRLHERIGEGLHVARRHPDFTRKNNGRIQAHHVTAGLNECPPPLFLDVFLQFNAERTVIPRRPSSPVDFTTRIHQAPAFTQVHHSVNYRCSHANLLVLHTTRYAERRVLHFRYILRHAPGDKPSTHHT